MRSMAIVSVLGGIAGARRQRGDPHGIDTAGGRWQRMRFIGLGHQEIAAAEAGVGAGGVQPQDGRQEPGVAPQCPLEFLSAGRRAPIARYVEMPDADLARQAQRDVWDAAQQRLNDVQGDWLNDTVAAFLRPAAPWESAEGVRIFIGGENIATTNRNTVEPFNHLTTNILSSKGATNGGCTGLLL